MEYLNHLFLKLYLSSSKESKEKQLCQEARETSLDLLSTCLLVIEFCFDATLFSNLGNENSDAGHIKSTRRLQVLQPCGIISDTTCYRRDFLRIYMAKYNPYENT